MSTFSTCTSSTRPGSPANGDVLFETDTKNVILWDGTNWRGYGNDLIAFAKGSTSADLDGTDDYVSVPDADNLSFGNGSSDSPFTLTAWLKSNTANNVRIIVKGDGTPQEYAFTAGSAGTPNLNLFDNAYGNSIQITSDTALTQGTWQHWAVTYDGTGSHANSKIYLNGSAVSTTTASTGSYVAMHNTSAALSIGRNNITVGGTTYESFTNGHMDDVAVIAKELSASEVSAIYNSNLYPTELVSLWRFEGNANDSQGSNNGTGENGVVLNSTDVRS
jgi:hypothetical protein